ncbi:MAG: PQQ-binding-like beta-propeller repeat protein [Candidatus Eremiobacteraeota bacterium]|nr:PQQ-binding-like beta-propeller repeat protein [Candidatus Eremiobacteraeota bacterium]MCW5869416.1 PQQ-binding-like beta-propeller repeat protein [Candidatus Eremiobacteraeota bacterium]
MRIVEPGWKKTILSAALLTVSAAPALAKKDTLPAASDYYLSFSDDGRRILCQRKEEVWVFQLEPRRQILHLTGIPSEAWTTLDPKGHRLAVREPEGSLAVYDCHTGKKLWKLSLSDRSATRILSPGLAFSPTGSKLLYLSSDKGILLDANKGRTLHSWSWPESTYYQNAFSPDGKVLFHGSTSSVQALSTSSGASLATFRITQQLMMVSYAENAAHALCNGGDLRISYPGLQRLASEYPAPQARADGQLHWRRTPAGLEVLNRDKVVYRGPLDHRVSWWTLCGGFPISSTRTKELIGLFAENGSVIPGATKGFSYVHGTRFAYVDSNNQFVAYDMRDGKRLGAVQTLKTPNSSPRGGKLAALTKDGIVIFDAVRSLQAGRLVVSGEAL